jgi:hypothetical protein
MITNVAFYNSQAVGPTFGKNNQSLEPCVDVKLKAGSMRRQHSEVIGLFGK